MRSLSSDGSESLVLAQCLSGFDAATPFFESIHGMQGVRSSSLLGSILEKTVLDRVFGGHLTAFFVVWLQPAVAC